MKEDETMSKNKIYLDMYIDYMNSHYKKNTINTYRLLIEKYVIRSLGQNSINNIKMVYHSIVNEKTNDAYKNKVLGSIKGFYLYLIKQNIQIDNIHLLDEKIRIDAIPIRREIYSEKDLDLFLVGSTQLQRAFFTTLFYTGLRSGEIRAITWNDVNFTEQYIDINKQVSDKIGRGTILPPKTKNAYRQVFIPNRVVKSLRVLRQDLIENGAFKNSYYVFGDKLPLHENKPRRWQKELEKANRIRHIRIHDFRHSYITMMYKKGLPPKVLQMQVGHSSIAITLDIYTQLDNQYNHKIIKDLLDT